MHASADADAALLELLGLLRAADYHFVTPTPDTHARILARDARPARDLRDIFGWSRSFAPAALPPAMLACLTRAGALIETPGGLKSALRVSSLGGDLFLHSAYPTEASDAVFFGPDSYRFADFIRASLPRLGPVRRLVDIGAGAGVGALSAARLLPGARLTLVDINPLALRLAGINAAFAGIAVERIEGAGIDAALGDIDLVIANPPFIMDEGKRDYRDGGDMHGARLSLDWTLAAAKRFAPGGHMLLYTGVAILDGRDALRAALEAKLPELGCALDYRELDPDIFGEELGNAPYAGVERIAAVGAVVTATG